MTLHVYYELHDYAEKTQRDKAQDTVGESHSTPMKVSFRYTYIVYFTKIRIVCPIWMVSRNDLTLISSLSVIIIQLLNVIQAIFIAFLCHSKYHVQVHS